MDETDVAMHDEAKTVAEIKLDTKGMINGNEEQVLHYASICEERPTPHLENLAAFWSLVTEKEAAQDFEVGNRLCEPKPDVWRFLSQETTPEMRQILVIELLGLFYCRFAHSTNPAYVPWELLLAIDLSTALGKDVLRPTDVFTVLDIFKKYQAVVFARVFRLENPYRTFFEEFKKQLLENQSDCQHLYDAIQENGFLRSTVDLGTSEWF